MAIVKLFNLSDKVQVLVQKYVCSETELPALKIETLIEMDDVVVSGAMRSEYEEYKMRDDVFENKTDLAMVTKAANSIINMILDDSEVEQYLIK